MWKNDCNDDDVNFEWPTQEIFDSLKTDVYLKTLIFKCWRQGCAAVSSVQVILSNGLASPVYESH